MDNIYVIGHVNPDTDSIASAMGYAWLLNARGDFDAIAARAGPINLQTTWILNRLGLESPVLLTDASPRFDAVMHRMDTITPDRPLLEAWAIANRTGGIAPVVKEDGIPYGLVTGISLFKYLSHSVGPHPRRQELRIAEVFEIPCRESCDTQVPKFQASNRIRDSLHRILREERNEFFVVDDQGRYVGVCRQRELLNPPRLKLILVDHNEPRQALASLEEAELIEVLDHHRLDNPSTHIPIRFTVDIVGSTSTLVSERIEEAGFRPPPGLAGLLMAGLLSDTLVLKSPTTTDRDHRAADRLARWAFVYNSPLADETLEAFGRQIMEAGSGLNTRDLDEIVSSDLKTYEAGGLRFAIAQVEVSDLVQLDEHSDGLYRVLKNLRDSRGLEFAMLMVTDVVGGSSRLIITEAPPELDDLPYPSVSPFQLNAEGMVSRKKQLLPIVLSLLED